MTIRFWTTNLARQSVQGFDLFPIGSTPMERFMLFDDSHEFPKSILIELSFKGPCHMAALRQALDTALSRHAMLCAVAARNSKGWHWTIPELVEIPGAEGGNFADSPYGRSIDPARHGLRYWVQIVPDGWSLTVEFHHALVDGLGTRAFLRDWMLAYDAISKQQTPEFPRLDPHLLLERGVVQPRHRNSSDRGNTTLWQKLVLGYRFHRHRPVSLHGIGSRYTHADGVTGPRAHQLNKFELSLEWTRELRSMTQRFSCSLNDLLAASWLYAAANWNARFTPELSAQLRLLVPTAIRSRSDRYMPSCNRMGFGFVSVFARSELDFASFVRESRMQIRAIQSLRLDQDFVDQFGLISRFEWLARRSLRTTKCLATGVLTNLGNMSHRFPNFARTDDGRLMIGGSTLEALFGVPPIRPGTEMGVAVCVYAKRLMIGMRSTMKPTDQEQFFHHWMQTLSHAK